MKSKKKMSELDSICNFILKSTDLYDFQIRFNYLLSILVSKFQNEISNPKYLHFNSYILIQSLNNDLNKIINKINKSNLPYSEGNIIAKDIFILIIREEYPEHYKNYFYQLEYRNN
jgi:hypothetical protein